ncbi:MAG: hypothetical protein ACSLEL_04580 [Candidatus Malihini olakiniferum]
MMLPIITRTSFLAVMSTYSVVSPLTLLLVDELLFAPNVPTRTTCANKSVVSSVEYGVASDIN